MFINSQLLGTYELNKLFSMVQIHPMIADDFRCSLVLETGFGLLPIRLWNRAKNLGPHRTPTSRKHWYGCLAMRAKIHTNWFVLGTYEEREAPFVTLSFKI